MRKSVAGRIAAAMLWLCAGTATCMNAAWAQTAAPTVAETSKGNALVDGNGMTLYILDRDAGGKSSCNGQCATNWPPLIAAADATASGDFSFITRDDGRKQWAYRGKPLYTWSKDSKPGDATGDGVNNVWHIAAP